MDVRNALKTFAGRLHRDGGIVRADGETDEEFISRGYGMTRRSGLIFLGVFAALFVFLVGYRITLGEYDISIGDVYRTIWHHITHNIVNPWDDNVVWMQRMPRVITAVLVGVGLATAGAAMQSMLKNPLADPYTTGISSGALFGATLAMTMGIAMIGGFYGRVLNAFLFAMIPALFITALSRWKKPTPAMMILVGIATMFIFNAFQQYMMLKADPNSAASVFTWSVGSIGMTTWEHIPILALVAVQGSLALFLMARTLNALNSGDRFAKSLGIDVDRTRILCLILVSLIAAGIVSFTGIIGFVGLVSPHIARIFVGSDNRILLPASALIGACMVLLCDTVCFLILGATMQIGIVTAMIGGPLFMAILIGQRKEVW